MNAQEVRHAILTGELDEDIELIDDALHTRKRRIAQHVFDIIEPDMTRIQIAGNIRPRYLIGATGTVVSKLEVNVVVLMDNDINDPYGKFAGRKLRLSPENFIIIDNPELPVLNNLQIEAAS